MISPTSFLYGGSAVSAAPTGTPAKASPGGAAGESRGIYKGVYKLCAHPHAEMNYRKKPLGLAGYKLADPFAPFQVSLPRRHAETPFSGMWFACGHYHPKQTYFKRCLQTFVPIFVGSIVGVAPWCTRMQRNGWIVKNKGAVSGTD
eukprot:PhM_4_TR1247/c4_g1_i4/m.28343